MEDPLKSVIDNINELQDDNTVPRNVKMKLLNIVEILKGEDDASIKINKALDELDEISDDANLQPYTRTQIWNLVSMLESI